jgi:hypothetical protein
MCVLSLVREKTISNWAIEVYTDGLLLREAMVAITVHPVAWKKGNRHVTVPQALVPYI